MFSAIENSSTSPRRWRSSGMWPRPESKCSWTPTFVTSCPSTTHRATVDAPQPGHRVDQLGLAVAVDPRDADDLARAHVERDAAHLLDPAVVEDLEVLDAEERLGRLGLGLVDAEQDVAADHQPGEALLRGALGRQGLDELAPAQHGDAVGDLCDLVQLVADEDDGRPLRGEAAHDLEQLPRLLRGEHCRRLVQREDVRVAVERLQDLDALLLPDA